MSVSSPRRGRCRCRPSRVYNLLRRHDLYWVAAKLEGAPEHPANASEADSLRRYVIMYGEAMRNSIAQVLANKSLIKKPQPDGIFSPSCFQHVVNDPVEVEGQKFLLLRNSQIELAELFKSEVKRTSSHRGQKAPNPR